jgi:hypothetical protein
MVAPQTDALKDEKKTPQITNPKMVTRGGKKKENRRLTLGLRAVAVAANA